MQHDIVHCLHSLICKECQVESDGTISLISIYSRLTIPNVPAKIPLCFVSFLELSLEKYGQSVQDLEVRILITSPAGHTLSDTRTTEYFEQISAEKARLTIPVEFGELEFLEFGTYKFEVFFKNEILCTEFFEILQK